MNEPKEISYKDASSILFINSEKKDTHVFSGSIGCCWQTAKLREEMRRSKLYFTGPCMFGGHQIVMVTPEGRQLRLETDDKKVKKYLERA